MNCKQCPYYSYMIARMRKKFGDENIEAVELTNWLKHMMNRQMIKQTINSMIQLGILERKSNCYGVSYIIIGK